MYYMFRPIVSIIRYTEPLLSVIPPYTSHIAIRAGITLSTQGQATGGDEYENITCP
jgi:hypothetical protein